MKKYSLVLSLAYILLPFVLFSSVFAQADPTSLFQAQITLKTVKIEGTAVELELEMGADPIQLEIPLAEDVINPDQRNNMLLTFSDISFELTPIGAAAWNSGIIEDFSIAIEYLDPEQNKRVEIGERIKALPTLRESVAFSVNDVDLTENGGMIAMQSTNLPPDPSVILTGTPGFWIDNLNPRTETEIAILNPNGADLENVAEAKIILPNFFRYNNLPVEDFDEIETLKLKFGKLSGEFSTGEKAQYSYAFFTNGEFELVFTK